MAEPRHRGISARVRKLPAQLLLALINATAILVIAAAILALVAIKRVDHFVESIAATMTDAVLSKVDLPSRDVLGNIRELTAEVRAVNNSIREIKSGENPVLQSEIARLKDSLAILSVNVDRLRSTRSILTDAVAERFGDTVKQTLQNLRNCPSDAGLDGSSTIKAEAPRNQR